MKKYFMQNLPVGMLCLLGVYLFFNNVLGSPMRVTVCALFAGFMGLFMQFLVVLDENYSGRNNSD